MSDRPVEHCVFILIDGGRPDAIEQGVEQGKLPNLKKLFFDEGDFRWSTSVFPSTTGPAYAPFLTGCFPGTCNLPGIRWLHRERFVSGRWNPRSVRSYVGIETFMMNKDLDCDFPTLFELLKPNANIFNAVNRGVSFSGNRTKVLRALYYLYAHYTGDWSAVDRKATKLLMKAVQKKPRFLFVVFPGVDEHSHLSDPFSKQSSLAYQDVDKAVGMLVDQLKELGMYERTLIVGSSDHGLSRTDNHLELWQLLEDNGYPTLYHPKVFRKGVKAACMVSGNGMANLYLQNGNGWGTPTLHEEVEKTGLLRKMLDREEIDHVITRKENGSAKVSGRGGVAEVRESNGRLQYQVYGKDPFDFEPMPKELTYSEALERTFDTNYPDALVQIAQLFRSPRTGDVIVNASLGNDLRFRHEHPEHFSSHGSLHREHMMIPFMINRKLNSNRPVRSVDTFPTILEAMGISSSSSRPIDGVSLI